MPVPPILISRRPRGLGSGWSNTRSWLGGRPRLGGVPWPRAGAEQVPLTFVAWIDLQHLTAQIPASLLPPEGALAFFLGALGCAVLHVPRTDQPDTDPPPDAPPTYTPYGEIFPTSGAVGSKTFPRWPVDLTALVPRTPAEEEDLGLVVDRHAVRREFFFTASTARKSLGDKPLPNFWHSAHHFAALLRAAAEKLETLRASRARYGATAEALTAFARGRPAFMAFVAEGERWVEGRPPWQEMAPDEVDHLRSLFARAKSEYHDYAKPWMPYSFEDIETVTLRALATADDHAWAKLPAPIQELLDRGYQLPTDSWHQMFGHGVDIQGQAVDAHAEDYLLLQLVYDDLMEWIFGDIGAFQFWISPADLHRVGGPPYR